MKKALFILAGLAVTATLNAQGGFSSPADTVYLQYGFSTVVHVKRIEPAKPGSISAYQIKTHESLDLSDKNIWSNIEGGYQWKAEQYKDGFRSGEVKKVVFADGFVLPFEGGEMHGKTRTDARYPGDDLLFRQRCRQSLHSTDELSG